MMKLASSTIRTALSFESQGNQKRCQVHQPPDEFLKSQNHPSWPAGSHANCQPDTHKTDKYMDRDAGDCAKR